MSSGRPDRYMAKIQGVTLSSTLVKGGEILDLKGGNTQSEGKPEKSR